MSDGKCGKRVCALKNPRKGVEEMHSTSFIFVTEPKTREHWVSKVKLWTQDAKHSATELTLKVATVPL